MNIRHALIATLAALGPLGAAPAAELGYVEEAFETTTAEAALPARPDGTVIVRTCATCAPATMPLTSQTKYHVGRDEVSFAELTQFLRGAGDRLLVVLYDPRKRTITGLAVQGELPRTRR